MRGSSTFLGKAEQTALLGCHSCHIRHVCVSVYTCILIYMVYMCASGIVHARSVGPNIPGNDTQQCLNRSPFPHAYYIKHHNSFNVKC